MINSNPNSIAQCDKHNMFICPNINNIIEENMEIDYSSNNYEKDEFPYMQRSNEEFFLEDNESEDYYHYNLMNRRMFNQGSQDFDNNAFMDNTHFPNNFQSEAQRILRRIERNNPEIFRFLLAYRIPLPVARRFVTRIIMLTLRYGNCKL